jgi:hypothetical protein
MMRLSVIAFVLSTASFSLFSQGVLEFSSYSDTLASGNLTFKIDSVYSLIEATKGVIEFEDCNVCKSRAHVTARVIERSFPGVTVGKVWLFADSKRKSQYEIYRYKPLVYLENKSICRSWGYHVAPVIFTASDTFVIDPATQTNAVNIRKWAMNLIPSGSKGFIVVKDKRYFIYPDDEKNLFEDEKYVWTDTESLLDDEYSRSIDEVVRASLGLVEPWKMNVIENTFKVS